MYIYIYIYIYMFEYGYIVLLYFISRVGYLRVGAHNPHKGGLCNSVGRICMAVFQKWVNCARGVHILLTKERILMVCWTNSWSLGTSKLVEMRRYLLHFVNTITPHSYTHTHTSPSPMHNQSPECTAIILNRRARTTCVYLWKITHSN